MTNGGTLGTGLRILANSIPNSFLLEATNGPLVLSSQYALNMTLGPTGTQINSDLLISQTNYSSMVESQLGYTLTGNFSGQASNGATPTQVGTFNLPAIKGVWIISMGWNISMITIGDTVSNKNVVISGTANSDTQLNEFGGWQYYEELNDTQTGSQLRNKGYLGGTYINTTAAVKNIFINAACPTDGSDRVTVSGGYSATRVG